ncbi:MAG: TonB-dependent receptor plug domain-containing protein [Bacteroidota bacterium]|nr:TonB-dependent receptor plug domain-containing protein [Bacteroidota bacterium]
MKKFFFVVYIVFSCHSLFSQIDTIRIPAVKISKTISKQIIFNQTIDSTFIQQNRDLQLTDLLKQSQSVFIKSFGNFGASTASFRGTSATHTQVLWNDVPLNSPMLGQTDFSLIPVFFTDKISTSAGIASLANSSGALGGAVLLNTYIKPTKDLNLNINQTFASFANSISSLNISIKKKKIAFNSRLEYSFGENNFKYFNSAIPNADVEMLENANFKQFSFLQNLYFRLNTKNQLSFFVWFTNADRNIPPIMSFEGLHRTENQADLKTIAGIKYVGIFNKLKLKNTLALSINKLTYFLGDSVFSAPQNSFILKNYSTSIEKTIINNFSAEFNFNTKFSASFVFKTTYNNVNTFDSASYHLNGYSAKRFNNYFNGLLIYRINDNNLFSFIVSESIIDDKIYSPVYVFSFKNGMNKQKGLFTQINVGKNKHIPTLNDLFWQPGGNPNLLPESGYSADFYFGYKYSDKKVDFTFKNTVFASLIDNWIIWKPTEFQYWKAQNIKKVFSRGNEIYISFYYKAKVSIKAIANYSFTLSTNQNSYYPDDLSVEKQLIYTPKHLGSLLFLLNYKKMNFSANFNYTGKRFTSTSNYGTFALNSYYLVDFAISRNIYFEKFKSKIDFKIFNVTNSQYQAILYRPMPRINFKLNFSVEI